MKLQNKKLIDHCQQLRLLIRSHGRQEAKLVSSSLIVAFEQGMRADMQNAAYYEAAHLIVFDPGTKELVREMTTLDDSYEYKKLLDSGIGGAVFQKQLTAAYSFVFGGE